MSAKKNNSSSRFPSELRYDIVSENWVIIATGRARRPHEFKKKTKDIRSPKKTCPFCHLETRKFPRLLLVNGKKIDLEKEKKIDKNWTVAIIPNKYPAFLPYQKLKTKKEGKFYRILNAVGFHEVVITRDHDKHLALLSVEKIKELIDAYHFRYQELMNFPQVKYIALFHNHGREAGASIYHPHSQIITTPLIDVDLKSALDNARRYFKKHRRCIYCEMNKWELKERKRIVFENKDFIVVCPFASRVSFQVIISPKKHACCFESIKEKQKWSLAESFKKAFYSIYKGLSNPAYNFYLHSAPVDGKDYSFYHWHFTILPKTSIFAGFELGAHMEISTIEPERAADYLRKQLKK